jgi:hypothetical protein
VRRHQLKDEGKAKEDAAAPPANGRQKVSCLSDSDQRIRRGARSTKACSETTALPALKQNGNNQDDTVYDEQSEKKGVKH